MAEVSQDKASKKARDLFNKGFSSFERGNLDYAIDLLSACVQIEPGFLQARKFLRHAEIQRCKQKKPGMLAAVKGLPKYTHAMALLQGGRFDAALLAAEELLKADPLSAKYVKAFARAADGAGLPEAAAQTLEIVQEHFPKDDNILQMLGEMYQKLGRTRDARQTFEKLIELRPHDLPALKLLKDSMALDSMSSDKWTETAEKKGTYREMIKDTKETVVLEQESKAVKSEKDADSLIAETLAKIAAEPGNVNYYRALARLYVQRKLFDDGIATLQKALEMNPGDPELDAAAGSARVQKYDYEIEQLKKAGDAEGAAVKEAERNQFYADDLQARVSRYPNDLKLRYEWGLLLFDNDMLNEAIQQFQLSQRSPKHRIRSLYYLGMCLKLKKQYDMALEQFANAREEIPSMDENKKDVLYEMGRIYELIGKPAEAAECYKQVYQVDIGYKDVATRVENVYKK